MNHKIYKFMRCQLDDAIDKAIVMSNDGGREICGLLVDNGYFIELIHVKNKKKQGGGFEFYAKEIRKIVSATELLDHEIVGTFHSHPFYIAKPGDNDIENAVDDSLMLIIDVADKMVALWHIKGKKIKKIKFDISG